jgi:3-deoxy-D-manno-octulosonic-acid transferase
MRRVRGLYAGVLKRVGAIAARTDEDADRFCDLGAPTARVAVLGDLKEDRAIGEWAPPTAAEPSWIAACTRPGEEPIILDALRAVASRLPRGELLLAPRHPDRFNEVAALVGEAGLPLRRWRQRGDDATAGWRVVLVDEMGVMDDAYRRATCAFVGGSLAPFGGHSPWEAAAAGRPVLMGRYVDQCRGAFDALRGAGAAQQVGSSDELAAAVIAVLEDPERAASTGRAARSVLVRRGGIARATVDFLRSHGVLA